MCARITVQAAVRQQKYDKKTTQKKGNGVRKHEERSQNQILSNISPGSRFMLLSVVLIAKASWTFRLVMNSSVIMTAACSHWTEWSVSVTCTAMPLLVSLLRTDSLCSISLVLRVRPVSPIHFSCCEFTEAKRCEMCTFTGQSVIII